MIFSEQAINPCAKDKNRAKIRAENLSKLILLFFQCVAELTSELSSN
jgi:hypothetical protein